MSYNVWSGENKTPLFVKNIKEGLEDTKGVIRICESKKDKQHNDQPKKDKMTNNDLQSITHKTEDWVTRTSLKTGMNAGAPEG